MIKGKPDGKLKGKWWCATRDGGCGHTFPPEDPRLADQPTGQVENENPYDLANTILKMARKRAGVDGILTTTGTSGLFTQDDDSPAVQRDAGATGQAATGGQRQADAPKRIELPKIPEGITADTSLGEVTLPGRMYATETGPADGMLRQLPDGAVLGFRIELPGEVKIPQVVTRGSLAEELAEAIGGDPGKLDGPGTVTGTMFAVPWTKKNDDGHVEQMPPFRRVEVTRIQTADWTLPANAPAAPAKPKGKAPAKSKDTPASAPAAEAARPAEAPAGPGLAMPALTSALDGARIAGAYALAEAKRLWPDTTTLNALTDQQRLELAQAMDLLTADEEDGDAGES